MTLMQFLGQIFVHVFVVQRLKVDNFVRLVEKIVTHGTLLVCYCN